VIATKFFFPMGDSINQRGCGKKHLFHAVQDSLERLDTTYIDVMILHCFDPYVLVLFFFFKFLILFNYLIFFFKKWKKLSQL
jgi:aryl-alcohol dehydrogenase-like predicted oxidoreductase